MIQIYLKCVQDRFICPRGLNALVFTKTRGVLMVTVNPAHAITASGKCILVGIGWHFEFSKKKLSTQEADHFLRHWKVYELCFAYEPLPKSESDAVEWIHYSSSHLFALYYGPAFLERRESAVLLDSDMFKRMLRRRYQAFPRVLFFGTSSSIMVITKRVVANADDLLVFLSGNFRHELKGDVSGVNGIIVLRPEVNVYVLRYQGWSYLYWKVNR